ncbi:hypothetical protein SEVIR_5G256551v4 [Setaria viridis]
MLRWSHDQPWTLREMVHLTLPRRPCTAPSELRSSHRFFQILPLHRLIHDDGLRASSSHNKPSKKHLSLQLESPHHPPPLTYGATRQTVSRRSRTRTPRQMEPSKRQSGLPRHCTRTRTRQTSDPPTPLHPPPMSRGAFEKPAELEAGRGPPRFADLFGAATRGERRG